MKKKATKLLAVVVIAASPGIVTADRASGEGSTANARVSRDSVASGVSSAAAAGASNGPTSSASPSNPSSASSDPWNPARDPWNTPRAIDTDRTRTALAELEGRIALVTARPREMPSGAPACGNVASRAPRPVECAPRTSGGAMLANAPANASVDNPANNTANTSVNNSANATVAPIATAIHDAPNHTPHVDPAHPSPVTSAVTHSPATGAGTTSISSLVTTAILFASIGDIP